MSFSGLTASLIPATTHNLKNMANMSTQDTNDNKMSFSVFRSGVRVSEMVYETREAARHEYEYWSGILRRWPDGTKMDILPSNYRRQRRKE